VGDLCKDRVVIVTGSGRGLGRAHALEFARQGAKVVVNDLGAEVDGSGGSDGPAGEVVEEIRGMGGEAIANGEDIADWEGSGRLVKAAIDAFGGLDVVVNNAGILRDRMFISTSEEEWDAVIRVHLKGHFCTSRHAAAYWRERSKAGDDVDARIINTSSGAGLQGSIAQSSYGAAKGGIASLTREHRAVFVRRRERRDRFVDVDSGRRNAALRRNVQRDRTRGENPYDRRRFCRDDGQARGGFRRHGSGERIASGGLARQL
jgi:NAD(P)-dependent dehydrogenase (short-subunit alcohol dehydrogenase family)